MNNLSPKVKVDFIELYYTRGESLRKALKGLHRKYCLKKIISKKY